MLNSWYGSMVLLIPAILLSLYAQAKVSSTFSKYSRQGNRMGYTGREVAERILRDAGIYDVRVEHVRGKLSDHYDPRNRVLRLSDSVYGSSSIAAVGVAAHECGHAIQHNQSYAFLSLRNAMFPVVNFSSKMAMPLVMLGLVLGGSYPGSFGQSMVQLGILLFTAVVAFQVVTLPVELNASNRAIHILETSRFLNEEEIKPARKVLNAAALTYIAAAAVALLNLLRLLMLFSGGRRND
ncbi:zinc metallopeptidase [Anaerotalea alkaliphila]|uniref:Zinc metallopeptidase n=1 Tax=Anaerotalea alkaliphila TaxID=2662126 RepID=A0A7X5HUF8_9FIRM|nr:zinc metallopeptidase [Anaerotalea alkaliphila]NDL66890.1 zinc metallopeptidase [Anaerotalea alkaliphila]